MSNTSKRTTDLSDASSDAWLDELLESFDPYDNSHNDFVHRKPRAKAAIQAHLQEREAAAELNGRIDELGGVGLEYGPYGAETFINGKQMSVADRFAELLAVREGRNG